MHDTNRIRNQIDSENETTLQIPLRGNAPGSRPLPDVRFLPRRHDGGDSESPAAPPRHRIRGTASAQRIHELHHPTERRERRPGGRMELSPGRELHPKPYRRRRHRLYGNGGTAGVLGRPHHHAALRRGAQQPPRLGQRHGGRLCPRQRHPLGVRAAECRSGPHEHAPHRTARRHGRTRIGTPPAAGRPHLVFPLFSAAHPHLGL